MNNYGTWRIVYGFKPVENELFKEVNPLYRKIGQSTLHATKEISNYTEDELKEHAYKDRVKSYTSTTGVSVKMTTARVVAQLDIVDEQEQATDHKVRKYLRQAGVKKVDLSGTSANEWMETDDRTIDTAITAYLDQNNKLLRDLLHANDIKLSFREEQLLAIDKTVKLWNKRNKKNSFSEMLWNAKPRFGKTATAYGFIEEIKARKILVLTHRPDVIKGWAQDIYKILDTDYQFVAKERNAKVEGVNILTWEQTDFELPFVYFISMQDARGAEDRGTTEKDEISFKESNKNIFSTQWDLIIVDEAHEGNETDKAISVHESLIRDFTLKLSGTPFKMLNSNEYSEEQIFTWDYTDEQQAKEDWYRRFPDKFNPYGELPAMSMYTINILPSEKEIDAVGESEIDGAFDFAKFFDLNDTKTGFTETADKEVGKWLDNISRSDSKEREDGAYMPFGSKMVKENGHTLWRLPSVAACNALEKKLKSHSVFRNYKILNVAGDWKKNTTKKHASALAWVQSEITDKPYETQTITLTVGRLTVGVTVGAWSAILWLANIQSPEQYWQTTFRSQSSCANLHLDYEGNVQPKTQCRNYDFAPDRALSMLTNTVGISGKAGVVIETEQDRKAVLGEFMNYCPVLAYDGNELQTYNVGEMIRTMKRLFSREVVENGFESNYLYSQKLLSMSASDLENFKTLKGLAGAATSRISDGKLTINDQGYTDKTYDEIKGQLEKQKQENPNKRELTEEEKQLLKEQSSRREQAQTARQILNAISIRIPLMILGSETYFDPKIMKNSNNKIEDTLKTFVNGMDDESWNEFMGKITKTVFKENLQWFDIDILQASIIEWLERVDKVYHSIITESAMRYEEMRKLLGFLKNPDKETVLTPPWVTELAYEKGNIDWIKAAKNSQTFYEINSKSGIFPLVATANLKKAHEENGTEITWEQVIEKQVFGNSRTKAGRFITLRVLGISRTSPLADNFTAIDVMKLHKTIEAWNSLKKAEKPTNWVKVKNPYQLVGSILKISNKGFMRTKGARLKYSESKWSQVYSKLDSGLAKIMQSSDSSVIGELADIMSKTEKQLTEAFKFDFTVSNPPYQDSFSGDATRGDPIYHHFIEIGKLIAKTSIMITPGRFLFRTGLTPNAWNEKMLTDPSVKVLFYTQNSQNLFPTADIKGGVTITEIVENRTDAGLGGIFIVDPVLKELLLKVKAVSTASIMGIVFDSRTFKLTEKAFETHPEIAQSSSIGQEKILGTNIFKTTPILFKEDGESGHIKILGLGAKQKRMIKFLPKEYLTHGRNLKEWKVFLPKANGSGAIGETLSTPLIGTPLIGTPLMACTQTFISIGKFESESEAEACLKYVKSRFARLMLGTLKVTQDNAVRTWENVPMQNFTENSDIDWTKSISKIDEQLFQKYSFTEQEIKWVKEKITVME